MADFNIPDGPDGETYDQEIARVRRHIPKELLPLWQSLVEPDDAPEVGWPEMVATFLQLSPSRVSATMGAMAMIHLVRSGASMMKVTSSTISMALGRGEPAMTILSKAYAAAKMTAVLASGDLRKNEALLPGVARIMTLIDKASDAQAQLASDGAACADPTHATLLKTTARALGEAAAAVMGDLGGAEAAPAVPPGSSVPPDQAAALLTVEISRVMRSYIAAVDSRTQTADAMPTAAAFSPACNTFGSLDFTDGLFVAYATGTMAAAFKKFSVVLGKEITAGGLQIDAVSHLVGHSAERVSSLVDSAKEAAHALADASIAVADAENALKWGGLSVELARAAAEAEELVK